MKSASRYVCAIVLFVLATTSCGPRATPTEAVADTPTAAEATPTNSPPLIRLVSLDLTGPAAGTEMQWVDGGSLVYVPGGPFEMGAGGPDNPEHVISLAPFWIYRTKVTNRMYRLCVSVGVCAPPVGEQAASDILNSHLQDRPVVDVTWQQAESYCEWVQGRLPTEAQWELTARGTESKVYPWGDAAPTCDLTNFKDCLGKTSRVFDYLNGKSPFNALDMAGNAFEWVADWYDNDYYPNGPDQDPLGPRVGTERVVRGSSFESETGEMPSALRFHNDPQNTRVDLGFRCVVQEPGVFAPYCQTSAYVPGDAGSTPPSRRCDASAHEVGRGCGLATYDISHDGELRAVEADPPLACSLAGDRVTCTGPGGASGAVSVILICGVATEGSELVDPDCLSGYAPIPGSEVHCAFTTPDSGSTDTGSGTCPPGTTESPGPGGLTLCVEVREDEDLEPVVELADEGTESESDTGAGPATPRDDCPGAMVAVTNADGTVSCRGTLEDGTTVDCPAGSFPMLTTDGYVCFSRGPSGPHGEPCPPGMYEAEGGALCIGAARTGLPGATPLDPCIEGFTYEADLGCCSSPGGDYPGCAEGEYRDTVHGCQPRPDESGGIITFVTFSAGLGACGGDDPDDDNPCSGLDKNACYATTGCVWEDATSVCH